MSYAIYKTEALIIRITPHGEASTEVTFLTRDLGKITARVQSSRKSESKMRMHITRYNHVVIDVVRGKNTWRLTGITGLQPLHTFKDQIFLHAWHRILLLAEHLIRGEDTHPELFQFVVNIAQNEEARGHRGLELFGVIHVLDMLGYWHGEKLPEIPTVVLLDAYLKNKKTLVKMINESIEATQIMV